MSQILTADTVARAVIAAARAYGADPVVAMTNRAGGKQRRPVTAAGVALVASRRASFDQTVRMLSLSGKGLRDAIARAGGGWAEGPISAAAAAMRSSPSMPRGER